MKTNTACTLFMKYANHEINKEEWYHVVLKSVLWESRKAVNVITSGLSTADSIMIYIPFDVDSNGLDYIKPIEYASKSSTEINSYWTLNTNNRIIKGIIDITTPINSISDVVKNYDNVFTIKSVDTFDYGSKHMQHWEVGGN